MRDFLIDYNISDVKPFLKAIENQFDFYTNLNIDMFKHAVTLPGLSLKVSFQFIPKTINMLQIYKNERMRNDDDNSLYNEWKQNIYGGLSIIFHRFH